MILEYVIKTLLQNSNLIIFITVTLQKNAIVPLLKFATISNYNYSDSDSDSNS